VRPDCLKTRRRADIRGFPDRIAHICAGISNHPPAVNPPQGNPKPLSVQAIVPRLAPTNTSMRIGPVPLLDSTQ